VIKAVIFDCFGVLYPQAMGKFLKENADLFENGAETLSRLNKQIDLGIITRNEFFAGLSRATGLPADKLKAEIDRQLVADDNLVGLIKKIKQQFKTGVISDAGKEEIEIIYIDGLDRIFDVIVASYQVGVTKPAPEIYLECSKKLGVEPSECLFVDDSRTNLDGAQEVGMQTLHYPIFGKIPEELEKIINK
jgi:HAD superfamily hydrolase (TIGR01509 family)